MLIRYHLFITTNIKNELGMIMGWKADGFVRMGCVLGGRDALSVYGYCSSDNYMTFLEFEDVKEELLRGFCLVKGDGSYNIVDGVKCSPIPKAMIDLMKFDYDDSAINESLDYMTDEEIESIKEYAKKTNNSKILKDKRWSEYFD